MIEPLKRAVRRHWPRLRLRTILLLTFLFVAALPGFGALFLRVYENTLVRQTEAELISQGAALSAAATMEWPNAPIVTSVEVYKPEPPSIDLREATILPERPASYLSGGDLNASVLAWRDRISPMIRLTSRTTLASILLLDNRGRILSGNEQGRMLDQVQEVRAALAGQTATVLRLNGSYRPRYAFEWLSRASNLRIHHARPIIVDGRVIGVLLLSRSPRALFVGIYADRGKILLGVVLIFGTLVMLSGLLSRGIARPIEQLGAATRAVASGGGAVPAPPTTAAVEIQSLYRDFGTMAKAIERRSRYLRDFAHAMSHEFKTPLAGISGAVELLQDHPDMTVEDRKRFLGNMAGDASRLTRLVSRLLDLARADMAEAKHVTTVTLPPALHRIADAYRSSGLEIVFDLAAGLPPVLVPEPVIEAVVTTLVENSRQAGATQMHIAGIHIENAVVVSVCDDGPGIPPSDRDRVFEPFFTSQRASGGTGLGLPITRSLLHAYGATINIIAEQTVGAAFALSLPVAKTVSGLSGRA